jgi:hypothetical protein
VAAVVVAAATHGAHVLQKENITEKEVKVTKD